MIIRLVYFRREGSSIIRDVAVTKTPEELINRARELIQEYPKAKFFMVNATEAKAPPEGHEGAYGKLWCPYCNSDRIFSYDVDLNVIKCSICHTGENNYYVKKYNPRDLDQ